jgi:pimeloyl-ACP methyl ester carboxylesterase
MARIVLVHGAFNELWGPNELKARWLPALQDGLWHHGVEVSEADVDVCFYGDLFRRAPGTEAEARLEQSRAGIAEMLTDLAGDAIGALGQAASDAAFDRTVDMVAVMATEPDLRSRMRARIEPLVGDDTRVIVAHSLGTVLSYMALANHPQWSVPTLVTLGSPLASPMIFGQLDPAPVDGQGVWPGGIERWVNVRAVGDKAAAVPLGEKFGARVEDVLVDNGHRAHAPEPYLNAAVTGAAVADALGR